MTEDTFGTVIRQARKELGYSQKDVARLTGLDFTYISKLENDRSEYAPSEDVCRLIAKHLQLDPDQLTCLVGRFPQHEEEFLRKHYKEIPVLFRRIRHDPKFARKIFREASKFQLEEESDPAL